jgi:hypothetical protein
MPEFIRSGFFIGKKEDDLHSTKWEKGGRPPFSQLIKKCGKNDTTVDFGNYGQIGKSTLEDPYSNFKSTLEDTFENSGQSGKNTNDGTFAKWKKGHYRPFFQFQKRHNRRF